MKQPSLHVIHAAAVRDALGVQASPGAVLVEGAKVVAAGDPASLPAERVQRAQIHAYPDQLLMPAFVNAHAHLELTAVGPQPYDPAGGFVGWVKMLRGGASMDPSERRRSVGRGAAQSLESGVQAVGDIASEPDFADARIEQGLDGQTYAELFGLGPPFDEAALRQIREGAGGLQPHAPYSAGPAIYEAAANSGRPVTTHLAETQEEARFVARGAGPWRDYLQSIDRWDDAFAGHYGKGLSPVQWIRPHLERAAGDGGWLVAHCNYVSDEDIATLAGTNASVAYCPIASEYFGHTGHRYRQMLDDGVNVCLGTDSIVCADPADPQPLGLMSAMRRLYQRDATDPQTILEMATTRGARALRLGQSAATLQPGAPACFALTPIDPGQAIDPLIQALRGHAPIHAVSFTEDDR